VSAEQNADGVEDEEPGQDQERVDGDLWLSASDFALCVFHERNDAVAEEQKEDQRPPDERGCERDVHDDKRSLVDVAEACSDDRRCSQASQYKSLRATDPEQESGNDSREEAKPAESFEQRLGALFRPLVRAWAVIRIQGSPVSHEGEDEQHERESDFQRGPK